MPSRFSIPPDTPESFYFRGVFVNVQMVCPITQDLIYEGQRADNSKVSCLVPHPDAFDRQTDYLNTRR